MVRRITDWVKKNIIISSAIGTIIGSLLLTAIGRALNWFTIEALWGSSLGAIKYFVLTYPHWFIHIVSAICIICLVSLCLSYKRFLYSKPLCEHDFDNDASLKDWEFYGDWSVENGTLRVTNSGDGGITKLGVDWKDYIFEFKTKIVNLNSSWIVRAKDIGNCYMFQCDTKRIRPHIRSKRQWVPLTDRAKEHNANIEPNEWFHVKIMVKGKMVRIFIDDRFVFKDRLLSEFRKGKVGFREDGIESACFRCIRVKPI